MKSLKHRLINFHSFKRKSPINSCLFIKSINYSQSFRKSSSSKSIINNKLINHNSFDSRNISNSLNKIINQKTQKKLKYLKNSELNYLFTKKEIDSYDHYNFDNNNNKKRTSLLFNKIHLKKKYQINSSRHSSFINSILNANLNNQDLDYFTERDSKKRISFKRFSSSALLGLKITEPSDVLEEHIDSKLKIHNKFAKFKLMLKKQKEQNIKLLNSIRETRILNENILKSNINEYRHKHNL
jgi:hypothetical protein